MAATLFFSLFSPIFFLVFSCVFSLSFLCANCTNTSAKRFHKALLVIHTNGTPNNTLVSLNRSENLIVQPACRVCPLPGDALSAVFTAYESPNLLLVDSAWSPCLTRAAWSIADLIPCRSSVHRDFRTVVAFCSFSLAIFLHFGFHMVVYRSTLFSNQDVEGCLME